MSDHCAKHLSQLTLQTLRDNIYVGFIFVAIYSYTD